MKITRVKLHNIGPYIDKENSFDLNVSKSKNIILIGGKNGSGKTTLLNSIKIGLFGSFAYGLKTGGNIYFESLKKIFNYVESGKKRSFFQIEIEFELVENYLINNYILTRSWAKNGIDINETISVHRNKIILLDNEKEEIQTKLREIMPPSIIDTMLFDGERIAQIIDDNKISEYLKEIINVNFNINIFDKMEDDVLYYIDKENNRKSFSTDEISLLECRNKYNENIKNQKNQTNIHQKYLMTLDEEKFKLKNLIKRFENYGGLTDTEKFSMRSSLELLESSRKSDIASIKDFLEDDIVFYLNRDKIEVIRKTIEDEKPLVFLKYVEEIEEYLSQEHTSILKDLLKQKCKNIDTVKYYFSPKLVKLIDNVSQKMKAKPSNELKKILNGTRLDLNDTKTYKKIIGNNENGNSDELQKLLSEIKFLEISSEEIKLKIKEIEKESKNIDSEVSSSLIELETLEKKIDSEKKEENSFNIARKILRVSSEYKKKQIGSTLLKIADLSVKKFQEINKKENYISKIIIEPETFNIILFDNNGLQKDISTLSAGEKQLLISAIVWSIFKLSDRNNLFTFDTPLARLDKENRKLFVEKILNTISDQVLILSTDQEIVEKTYQILKPNISKEYLLLNDEKYGKTEIKEGYFNNEW